MEKNEAQEKQPIKLSRYRISIARHLVQAASFILIFGGLFGIVATHLILPILAPFGNPYTTVGGAWAFLEITITAGIFPALAISVIALSSLLVGRLFCGWVCPLGFIYDIESFFGEHINVSTPSNRMGAKLSLILAAIFLFVSIAIGYRAAIGKPINEIFGKLVREPFSILDPLSTIASMLFWFFWLEKYPTELAGLADIPMVFWVRIVFLFISFLLSYYVTRGYCRYLCPLGGVVGVGGQYGLLTVSRDGRKCQGGCKECERACPMGIKLRDFDGRVESQLCILCGACIEKCESDALTLHLGG